MIFETKKIQIETLSEYLAGARQELGLTLEEVSEKTKIQPKFLESLEQNHLEKLPADVYVFGFLRELSKFYSVDPLLLIEQFKKERSIVRQLKKNSALNPSQITKIFGRIIITPRYLTILIGLVFVSITLGYIVWQVASINKQPVLEIVAPTDRQIIHDSVVTVSGKTDPGIMVSINDQNVFVDNQGNFSAQVSINNGVQSLNFLAHNKFNKSVTKTLTVIGQTVPDQSSTSTSTPQAVVQLRIEFSDDVTLDFKIDNSAAQRATFSAGEVKVLSGLQKIVISTTNAGATHVYYNNDDFGLLGKPKEVLKNVAFSAKSDTIPTVTE